MRIMGKKRAQAQVGLTGQRETLTFASTLIALSNETCAPSQEDAVCP